MLDIALSSNLITCKLNECQKQNNNNNKKGKYYYYFV